MSDLQRLLSQQEEADRRHRCGCGVRLHCCCS
jgi:hypothetical protein